MSMRTLATTTVVLIAMPFGSLSSANIEEAGAILHVASNGLDSASCGRAATPCRSISQAMENASDGDTVLVGPGMYGDLNHNGILGEPNEEFPENGRNCYICIDKKLRVISSAGAAVTVLNGQGQAEDAIGPFVRIRSDDVQFGAVAHGFTVRDAQFLVTTEGSRSNVRVSGNKVIGATFDGITLSVAGGRNVISYNSVESTGERGIDLTATAGSRTLVHHNVVRRVFEHYAIRGSGKFRIFNNTALEGEGTNNGTGFALGVNNAEIARNVAVGTWQGISVSGAGNFVTENVAVGNGDCGAIITGASNEFHRNDIYGNGIGTESPATLNCGLKASAGVNATNNYWGASTGPGPDPADQVYAPPSVPIVPFATRPFNRGTNFGR
jgi:hypothetical protein